MKTNAIKSVLGVLGLVAATASPAFGVVTDDFESYTVGQNADVANPAIYGSNGVSAVGVISAGASTANVPSSNVLDQNASAAAYATRVNGSDIVGSATFSFDFRHTDGISNIYFDDNTTNDQGGLIRFIEAGAGAPTQYFIQANGIDFALVEFSDWYRMTVDLVVSNPGADTYSITVHNLTTDSAVSTFGATSGATSVDVDRINRLQIETQLGGVLQVDNITIPEPGALSLVALGGLAMLARRRRSA